MAKNHHYISCFIAGNWATPRAAELLQNPPLQAVQQYHRAMQGPRRGRYVCTLSKTAKEFVPKRVDKVFVQKDLYTLPRYDDPLLRGLLHVFAGPKLGIKVPPVSTVSDLYRVAELPFDYRAPEEALAKIDYQACKVFDEMRSTKRIPGASREFLLKYLGGMYFRSAGWIERYQAQFGAIVNRRLGIRSSAQHLAVQRAARQVMDDAVLILGLVELDRYPQPFRKIRGLKLDLLLARGSVGGFVIGDNPVRPYHQQLWPELERPNLPRPGLTQRDVVALFPFAPECALLFNRLRGGVFFKRRNVGNQQVRVLNTATAKLAFDEVVFPGTRPDEYLEDTRAFSLVPYVEPKDLTISL